jgi:hypothetical protein
MDISENARIYDTAVSGGPCSNPNGDCNEIIGYAWNSAAGEQRITRETNCGGAQPFLGDSLASGNPRTVRVINDVLTINNGAGTPAAFRYYNGQNIELFPTSADQSAIPDIRRIDITLGMETDEVAPDTMQRRRMIYSTTVLLRNHVLGP